ncbi:hypothetical protein [Thorsellia anophelis]|uniref:Uncharacterized protein n=1 Tax=Thorsellia anophelis DSM 18579 TaxID=1123402 RepID=A0A1I0B6N6_9GAMM|nr:hypothetical protein [Thorsellia anophelis]SET01700.1 hypothetical protein SAMN02583745_01143 [Thorsellia anophelis DSM 18579]
MQRFKFALMPTVIAVMLSASLSHTLAYAEPRAASDSLLIKGHAPYIAKIAAIGELYEGNTVSLMPKSGRLYLPIDEDLDIRALDEQTDTYPGDLTLEGSSVEWWLLPADYAAQTLPLSAEPENLVGEFAGAELLATQTTAEVVLPAGSAGKKLGFRVIPKSETGLPTVGRRLDVLDVAFVSGQDENGEPITPDEPGLAAGPDPDNPGIIGGDTDVTYYTRIYTFEDDPNVELDPLTPAGMNTDGKKIFLWDETGLTPAEQIKPFADTHTTYYAQIVSFKDNDITQDNLVDNTDTFKASIVWRLKLDDNEGNGTYIRLDGTQTTIAPTAEAIDTRGQATFTTQITNKAAQVATGAERSEQGTQISFVFDDGKEPDIEPEVEPVVSEDNNTPLPVNIEEVTDETTP